VYAFSLLKCILQEKNFDGRNKPDIQNRWEERKCASSPFLQPHLRLGFCHLARMSIAGELAVCRGQVCVAAQVCAPPPTRTCSSAASTAPTHRPRPHAGCDVPGWRRVRASPPPALSKHSEARPLLPPVVSEPSDQETRVMSRGRGRE
jgi:hypothetical protein